MTAARTEEMPVVVGLGASAGGIRALQGFFERVAPDSGAAYVVVLHLSPDHDSQLARVLQASASIPVTQVSDAVTVQPDHVYVAPPDKHLTMADGKLTVSPNTTIEDRRAPVDIFFRTLAESHGSSAVCVILSGTGANGSMGLKRIKERAGTILVQNPREAEFSDMPRNAIATGLVDEVLPVAEIPARISTYLARREQLDLPSEDPELKENPQALRDIFTQLRLRTGHDFSNYKRPTLLRRVARRVAFRNLPDLASYAAYLHDTPEEADFLLKDLLISVANFFRDPKAFETLENEVVPNLFKGKGAGDQVRAWVVGCATGEEAYSLAMLLAECTLGVIDAPKVQIFATDIDEVAIAAAREGLYSLNDAADVSPDRLHLFFSKEGEAYRVRREIREMILFARHNVLKDPPFSRLDLVTCRNLLIYLNQPAQQRVMETLHFALRPEGYLLLGNSETVEAAGHLYTDVRRDQRLYQSRPVAVRQYPLPESLPSLQLKGLETPAQPGEKQGKERPSYGDLHGRLLEAYAPPSLIIDEKQDVVHLSANVGRFLHMAGGEPSDNLLQLIRPELQVPLHAALEQAAQQSTEARAGPTALEDGTTVTIRVLPTLRHDDSAQGYMVVLFDEVSAAPTTEAATVADEPINKQLEAEISRLKADLRTSQAHHRAQTEELRASNEELQALNEELRSAAEELETSKEELQSINEELTTVNQELKVQVEETSLISNNLLNLINSTDFGVIFLDRNFRVQLFSPASREVFNLIPSDVGRPLADITNRLEDPQLQQDCEEVLESLHGVEREVATNDRRFFLIRIVPYRTSEDRINGVVITCVDISARRRAEEGLRQLNETLEKRVEERTEAWLNSRTRFQRAFEAGPTASVITSLEEDRFREVNAAFTEMTGYTLEDVEGRTAAELGMWSSREDQEKLAAALKDGNSFRHLELHLRTKSGSELDILKSGEQVKMDGDEAWLKMFLDITERNRTQEGLKKSIEAVMTDTDWFSREVMERMALSRGGPAQSSPVSDLTARELEVLEHTAAGSNIPAIAEALGVSQKTVRNHIGNIYTKIGVHSRVEAVVWAREHGIVGPGD